MLRKALSNFPSLSHKRLLILLVLSPLITFATVDSYALEQPKCSQTNIYSYSYDALYDYQLDASVKVDQKIAFKSLVNGCTIRSFSLKIGSSDVENVRAQIGNAPLNLEVNKKDNVTEINIKFSDADQANLARYGDVLRFNLTYVQKKLSEKLGQVWEISLPKISISEQIDRYDVTAAIPVGYGPVHFMDPSPDRSETKGGKNFYYFSKDKLLDHGVVAAFGEAQIFDFQLNYHLENKNIIPVLQEITLPPDTEYQRVSFISVSPAPYQVYTDIDGNYIGVYKLERNQKLDIVAKGNVKITDRKVLNEFPAPSESFLQKYLKPQKYWDTTDQFIAKKAKELKNPKDIYNYVVNALKYGYDRVNKGDLDRLGALGAVNNPDKAICMEFTDLFIALSRAAGIPAREVNGYAYTEDKQNRPTTIGGKQSSDILHAWPEYFDKEKKIWIQVDPTWGNTTGKLDYFNKLDTNHFVFIRKGVSSEYPYPAGSFKRDENTDDNDVMVKFADKEEFTPPKLDIAIDARSIPSGFSNLVKVNVKNTGTLSLLNAKVSVVAPKLEILQDIADQNVNTILPFGDTSVGLKVRDKELFSQTEVPIKITVSGTYNNTPVSFEREENIAIEPFYKVLLVPLTLIIGFLVSIIFLAILAIHLLRNPRYLVPRNRR